MFVEGQIAEAVLSELVEGLESEASPSIDELKSIVSKISVEIEKIRRVNVTSLVRHDRQDRAQRLLKYLDQVNKSTYNKEIMQDNQNCKIIIESITRLYFLTEEFFALRGVINRPRFMMTATDDMAKMYFRKDFEPELLDNSSEYLRIERVASKRGGSFGLRFMGDTVMAQMKRTIASNEKEAQTARQLYEHYQSFTASYRAWGGKVNEGVMREAFELHLEKMHASLNQDGSFNPSCDMESEGRRWVMYRHASGSDPYFTGPDTALSQVKAENASLVSNIDTVLNTAEFIVQHGLTISTENLKTALKTKSGDEIKDFSSKIWKHLDKSVQDEIIKAMGGSESIVRKFHVTIR